MSAKTAPATIAGPGELTHPFELPGLGYGHDALAPVIDAETMELHHGKHHQAYVDKLNDAVKDDASAKGKPLGELMAGVSKLPKAVRNNGGGHWNHTFFWASMTAPGKGGEPEGGLKAAIDKAFGSFDDFKSRFEAAGVGQFGSGWAWLIVNGSGELEITSTPNQDNPLMDVAEKPGKPILGNDVWEHAYYITYRNKRPDYLKAWWKVVDWSVIGQRYAEATK
jgi:superoxide dismutase, Fe-Mn family